MPRSIPQHLIRDALYVVNYLEFLDVKDNKRFIYIAVKQDDIDAFFKACEKGNVDTADYGVILEVGDGTAPDMLKAKMEFQYKVDHSKMVRFG